MFQILLIVIYLAFISLGLPDSMLGAAWPSMYEELGVPISYAGVLSMIIAVGTVISSLASDFLTKKLGAGRVTALSVALTAAAMLGFSFSNSFWLLCLLALPYGLGAGSVDAALNNYVALHYSSRQMSWLHCMWGVGTIVGPSIMGGVLTAGKNWHTGFTAVSVIQIVLSLIIFASLPLWKKTADSVGEEAQKPIGIINTLKIKGAKEVMITFFCYCAAESTAMLWVSSYMNLHIKMPAEKAAGLSGLLFFGITLGRFLSGFLTAKFSDTAMIRIGQGIMILGSVLLLLPIGTAGAVAAFSLIGLGCAPVYPCIIHSTPARFGEDKSQAMIGIQMASAYIGTCLMPLLFGFLANRISIALLPIYLLLITALMVIMHESLVKKTA